MTHKTALVYRTSEKGITPSVETFVDYKGMQGFVNGNIERVSIPFIIDDVNYDVYVNEEGLFTEELASMILYHEGEMHNIIKGNFFISKANEEGDSVSLSEDEIMNIREYVARNTHIFEVKSDIGEKYHTKLFVAHY